MCWYAEHSPDEITVDLIKMYEDRVSEDYRTLMSAIAMTASISLPAYERIRPHLAELYKLEERVAIASRRISTDHSGAVDALRRHANEAEAMRDQLPVVLHEVMALAESRDERLRLPGAPIAPVAGHASGQPGRASRPRACRPR